MAMYATAAGASLTRWTELPCQRCGGGKGPKYIDGKFCGHCTHKVSKERRNNAHARALEARYGITSADYWDLYAWQGGVCYICRRATGKTRRLSVDHDHSTGIVRGLLCRPCNNYLGHLRDSREALLRAAGYLDAPPFAAMLMGKKKANGAQDGNGIGRGHPEGVRGDERA